MDSRAFPLDIPTKKIILNVIFGCQVEIRDFHENAKLGHSYFEYYRKVVDNCPPSCTVRTHRKIVSLVGLLKQPGRSRSSIEVALRQTIPATDAEDSDVIVAEAINVAMSLLLMIPTETTTSVGKRITVSGNTKLLWADETLPELINNEFPLSDSMKETVKLERIFNARNIERIAGIEVRWTSNLADHLRMRDDDTAVEIFHYASFLNFHQANQIHHILPSALIDETRRTLALLLPEHDREVELWFKSQQQNHTKSPMSSRLPLDPQARECGQLKVEERQIEKFEIWRDRLVVLKQVFDEAEPSNIRQWWHDRRRRVQWYTFWIAAVVLALTILFGLVQSIEGGMQVYYAARSST